MHELEYVRCSFTFLGAMHGNSGICSYSITLSAIVSIEDVAGEYEDIDLHKSGAGWVIFAAGVGIIDLQFFD